MDGENDDEKTGKVVRLPTTVTKRDDKGVVDTRYSDDTVTSMTVHDQPSASDGVNDRLFFRIINDCGKQSLEMKANNIENY